MIERYEKEEISRIWSLENKYKYFLKTEMALLQALEGKIIPNDISQHFQNVKIDLKRIDEIEAEVKHDVIAFCTSITEQVPTEFSKYFHYGVTSSDIIDTALSLQIKDSLDHIILALKETIGAMENRALEMKDCLSMGRSHGMNAEPLSFGQKLLGFVAEFKRRLVDIENFYASELTAQFSGAVGSYTILTPEIEESAAKSLGLKVEPVSTQIIPRDRIAKLASLHGLLAAAIERFAVEIRHLHHSDIGELNEGFSKSQKGSSTMPHKKNPISGENLTGLTRVLKSHVSLALENTVLWHERDISHSSAERLFLPDNFGIMYYALKRLSSTIENLVFHKEKIKNKTQNNFSYLSSYYLHLLIRYTESSRESLYRVVQKAAFEGSEVEKDSAELFHQRIIEHCKKEKIEISQIPEFTNPNIENVFMGSVDKVFKRVNKY